MEDLAYKKIIHCSKANDIRNVGKYLYKRKCKWKNRIRKLALRDNEVGQ
jgi:hypothetical protein